MKRSLPQGLYGITDTASGDPIRNGLALAKAGCPTVQLRAKGWSDGDTLLAAKELAAKLAPLGTCFIVNDHIDIAIASGAHGVHLGQDDGSIQDARKRVGPHMLIGWSTHTLAQAAGATGADYIGFGPVYQTHSKTDALQPRGSSLLKEVVCTTRCPVVAIGGIEASVLHEVIATGVHGWACISALRGPGGIAQAVAQMHRS